MTTTAYVSRVGNQVSHQRAHQLRHPDRAQAREATKYAVLTGKIPPARTLPCTDCGQRADEYDHFKGYALENRLDIQPVCRRCHQSREQLRRDYIRVAAPELYEALRITVVLLTSWYPQGHPALDIARAALAKADGR